MRSPFAFWRPFTLAKNTQPKCCLGLLTLALVQIFAPSAFGIGQTRYIETSPGDGNFPLVQNSVAATICVDSNDFAGVRRAAGDLREDIHRVTTVSPTLLTTDAPAGKSLILIGTLGKSALIDRLVRDGKLNAAPISGKWESFIIQTVSSPLPGVDQALVVAGSDKRGTIFGIYDVSEQIGVSPWYWWGDVPVAHKDALFVRVGIYMHGPPSVKYRGIFLNDEAPDLSNWVRAKYGNVPDLGNVANYGHAFYTNIFEVILRLKGNYLWPAMWNNAFNEDDPENPRLADEYGIVMGTSHQEPMLRAQKEWDRSYQRRNRELELQQHQSAASPAAILARWHPAQQKLRKHHHARLACRERQRRSHRRRVDRANRRCSAQNPRRGNESGPVPRPAGVVSLQGSAGILRGRLARPGRRHPLVGRG